MNEDLIILSEFLITKYFPKRVGMVTAREVLIDINMRLESINMKLGTNFKKPVSEPNFREMVNYIRTWNLGGKMKLIGKANGYCLSDDKEEVSKHIRSMEKRIESMIKAIDGLKKELVFEEEGNVRVQRSKVVEYKDKKPVRGDLFEWL